MLSSVSELALSSTTFEGESLEEVSDESRPYLVLAGSAATMGTSPRQRLIPVGDGLQIGREGSHVGENGHRHLSLSDHYVSSAHARVVRSMDGFQLVDLSSRNGTFVQGRPAQCAPLHDGTPIFFGGSGAVFRYLSDDSVAAIEEDLAAAFGPVATASASMALVLRKLRRMAPTREDILITGETGTGKEVYARAVHALSGRKGPFVGINCAAIPTELVESELFGFVRGAHSQAGQNRPGLIQQAEGGTLLLDEIGDMPPGAQAKLLRFLQEREVTPLGGTSPRRVDVRVLAATSRAHSQAEGASLRRDLMARLSGQPIVLPPLRERPEDIGALAHHMIGGRGVAFHNRAFLALFLYDWPGNVRELDRVIREAVIFGAGTGRIGLAQLPEAVAGRSTSAPASGRPARRRASRPAPSRDQLDALLRRYDGNVAEVARNLDRRWSVVWRWLKRYGLEAERFRMP